MNAGIVVNGAFRGQAITGVQRYATELAARLPWPELRRRDESGGPLSAWAWSQTLGLRAGRRTLLTFTSRGPALHRNQVVVVHDLFVLTHPEWYSRAYSLTHAPILRTQLRTARAVVTSSGPVAGEVRRLLGPRIPIAVVPGAPAEIFRHVDAQAARALVQRRHGLTAGSFLFAVASRDPRKNIERLLRAYAGLPARWRRDHPLVLAGGSLPAVFAPVETGPSVEGVEQLGYVSDEELAALYATAGRVLLLSLDEGFGLPAVEALAAGGRLLASDIPVTRWVCGDDALYVRPADEEAIRAALTDLDREAPGRGRGAAYSWEAGARVLRDFVEAL